MDEDHPGGPVCDLPSRELRRRVLDWNKVIDAGLTARASIPGGVRLTFTPEPSLLHDLGRLVGAERACCSWASWTLTSAAEGVVVEVTAADRHSDVVREMFGVPTRADATRVLRTRREHPPRR